MYKRQAFEDGRYVLKKALDLSKDQSYVLYDMTQEQLAHTLFPLGELCKTQTRRIAEEADFLNAEKPDSQYTVSYTHLDVYKRQRPFRP